MAPTKRGVEGMPMSLSPIGSGANAPVNVSEPPSGAGPEAAASVAGQSMVEGATPHQNLAAATGLTVVTVMDSIDMSKAVNYSNSISNTVNSIVGKSGPGPWGLQPTDAPSAAAMVADGVAVLSGFRAI